MSKEPRRINVSENRAIIEKGKHYTQFNAYDPDFLETYQEKILGVFSSNPELQNLLRNNMSGITEFIIGDRVANGLGVVGCAFNPDGARQIHMDTQFFDEKDGTFTIKPGFEYVDTLIIDALLHVAAGKKGNLTGVVERARDENGKSTGKKKNVGLNEGINQFLAEKITGKQVSADINSRSYSTEMVSLLTDVFGADIVINSYFGDNNILKDAMNELAQDPEFYDKFNRDLDTISKLQTTVSRIKSVAIKPKDPESLEKMEIVLKAQQERLAEIVFANVIIPQIQKIVNDDRSIMYDERQQKLLSILGNHSYLLDVVSKYIAPSMHSDFVLDSALAAIQKEIRENGIDFSQVAEAARKIDESKKTSTRTANTFQEEVNNFYTNAGDNLTIDRATELSPFLKRELTRMLEVYDQVKENDPEGFVAYDRWFRAHFERIPNLDEEIAKIRAEKEAEQTKKKAETADLDEILDSARKAGAAQADEDLGGKKKPDEPKRPKEEPKEQEDTSVLSKSFVASDLTGQVFDQRKESLYTKTLNYALATGERINPDDTLLVDMRNKAVEKYMQNLPSTPSKALYAVYGEKWREVLAQAYAEGYRQGMANRLAEATQQGLEQREELEKNILKGNPIKEPARDMSFEELKFINETFTIAPREDGTFAIVNRETNTIVLSDRTATATCFAEEWTNATGVAKEDGKLDAFTPKHAELFANIQTVVKNNTNETGEIDLDQVMDTLESKGEGYAAIGTALLGDMEHVQLFSEFNNLGVEKLTTPPVEERKSESPLEPPRRPESPLTNLSQVVEYANEATLEEVTPHLDVFGGESEQKDGITHHPFNDPLTAAKLNERYRTLKGEDHPMFVANAPILIDKLMSDKDMFLEAKAYSPEYFEQLAAVRKDLETRHPELVATTTEEKTGHK